MNLIHLGATAHCSGSSLQCDELVPEYQASCSRQLTRSVNAQVSLSEFLGILYNGPPKPQAVVLIGTRWLVPFPACNTHRHALIILFTATNMRGLFESSRSSRSPSCTIKQAKKNSFAGLCTTFNSPCRVLGSGKMLFVHPHIHPKPTSRTRAPQARGQLEQD